MTRFLALLAALWLAVSPAVVTAQSVVPAYPTGGSSSPVNQDNSFETLGYVGAASTLTPVNTNTTAHAKGTPVSMGVTPSAWAGFWLIIGQGNSNNVRLLIDVTTGAGTTVIAPNIYYQPGVGGGTASANAVFIPLNVAAGTQLYVRTQGSASGTQTTGFALRGIVRNATSPPMWNTMTAISVDAPAIAGTTASSIVTPLVSSLTWTPQATTAASYGALLMIPSISTSDPSNQDLTVAWATGLPGAEVEFYRQTFSTSTGVPIYRPIDIGLVQRAIGGSVVISAAAMAATPGTANIALGIYGFN